MCVFIIGLSDDDVMLFVNVCDMLIIVKLIIEVVEDTLAFEIGAVALNSSELKLELLCVLNFFWKL